MCLLALFFRAIKDAPVLVGANREEAYARKGEPPRLVEGPVRFVAGMDPVAGGTWFGINAPGVIVGGTNRPKSIVSPTPRSPGVFVLGLFGCPTAAPAARRAAGNLARKLLCGRHLPRMDE